MRSTLHPTGHALVAIGIVLGIATAHAEEGPRPVAVTVVAEYPGQLEGIDKVQLRRVVFQPGASVELTVDGIEFCNGTAGTWTVTNRSTGHTVMYGPGSRWAGAPLGTEVEIANHGTVPAEQWVVKLVPVQ